MDNFIKDDTFLARWVEGNLTDQELESFEMHPQFDQYSKLIKETGNLNPLVPDVEGILTKIKSKRSLSTIAYRPVLFRRRIVIGIAAALLFLVTGYLAFDSNSVHLSTEIGEQLAIQLPDGSDLILNAKSAAVYNKKTFKEERVVKLTGEGYFEVAKGSEFRVETKNGIVTVLGTSFNVLDRDNVLQISCKTGRVSVENLAGNKVILNPGDQVRIENEIMSDIKNVSSTSISNWKTGKSKFERVPLIDVIIAIENHFGVNIELDKNKASDTFTGGFIHDDLDKALEMVFTPMGLEFEMKSEGIVVVH